MLKTKANLDKAIERLEAKVHHNETMSDLMDDARVCNYYYHDEAEKYAHLIRVLLGEE